MIGPCTPGGLSYQITRFQSTIIPKNSHPIYNIQISFDNIPKYSLCRSLYKIQIPCTKIPPFSVIYKIQPYNFWGTGPLWYGGGLFFIIQAKKGVFLEFPYYCKEGIFPIFPLKMGGGLSIIFADLKKGGLSGRATHTCYQYGSAPPPPGWKGPTWHWNHWWEAVSPYLQCGFYTLG